jgi:hypothetical protein
MKKIIKKQKEQDLSMTKVKGTIDKYYVIDNREDYTLKEHWLEDSEDLCMFKYNKELNFDME